MNQYDLSLVDIVNIINSENIQLPLGEIEYTDGKMEIVIPQAYAYIENIKDTILLDTTAEGVVRLKDIA